MLQEEIIIYYFEPNVFLSIYIKNRKAYIYYAALLYTYSVYQSIVKIGFSIAYPHFTFRVVLQKVN